MRVDPPTEPAKGRATLVMKLAKLLADLESYGITNPKEIL